MLQEGTLPCQIQILLLTVKKWHNVQIYLIGVYFIHASTFKCDSEYSHCILHLVKLMNTSSV